MHNNSLEFLKQYEAYGEVLKLFSTFTPRVLAEDSEYTNDYISVDRFVTDNSMRFDVYFITVTGYKYHLLKSIWFSCDGTNVPSKITSLDDCIFGVIGGRLNEIQFENRDDIRGDSIYKLQYPLDSAEYFQRLTRHDLPSEEWIDRFMYTNKYVLDNCPSFNSCYTHIMSTAASSIVESTEQLMPYIIDAVKGLMNKEKS